MPKGLLKTALRCDDPVMFLEHKKLLKIKGAVPEGEYFTPFGKANIVRPGKDVTVVAISYHGDQSLWRRPISWKRKASPWK